MNRFKNYKMQCKIYGGSELESESGRMASKRIYPLYAEMLAAGLLVPKPENIPQQPVYNDSILRDLSDSSIFSQDDPLVKIFHKFYKFLFQKLNENFISLSSLLELYRKIISTELIRYLIHNNIKHIVFLVDRLLFGPATGETSKEGEGYKEFAQGFSSIWFYIIILWRNVKRI